jgi:hypothetical protein
LDHAKVVLGVLVAVLSLDLVPSGRRTARCGQIVIEPAPPAGQVVGAIARGRSGGLA